MLLKYYKGSLIFTALGLLLGAWVGWQLEGTVPGMLSVLWIIVVLSILEVSLSFDNAVVNASVLRGMDEIWRKRFLTWGILLAVFGMRIVFPVVVVALAASLGPIEAVKLAATNPERYEQILTDAHTGIAGFGGAFLAMVGLKFFFNSDKEVHWIDWIEKRLAKFSNVEAVEIGLLLLLLYGVSTMLPEAKALTFLVSGVFGIVTFVAVEAVNTLLGGEPGHADAANGAVVQSGLAGFLYLNVLDASFSFDGVIGAFALSSNLFIIAIGLGIGAFFVRSMTIMLVDKGTLAEYRYLEHGAFWAILALAAIMLLTAKFHIPEIVTGLIGATLIGISLWWSIRYNRANPDTEIEKALAGD